MELTALSPRAAAAANLPLDQLANNARLSEAQKVAEAGRQFEAVLLRQILGEGMKPAFTDDAIGLAIGPLFIMTELFFALGLKAGLKEYVEARVGPLLAARNGAPIGPPGDGATSGPAPETPPATRA